MCDPPFTDDLDLTSVSSRDELAALLRVVYVRADKPSLRDLEVRTRHGETHLSKTVLSEMLRGVRFPRKAVMVTFLRACGVQDDHLEAWRRVWERIADRDVEPRRQDVTGVGLGERANVFADRTKSFSSLPQDAERAHASNDSRRWPGGVSPEAPEIVQLRDQINQLHVDNIRLRQQLARADPTRTRRESSVADAVNMQAVHSPLARRRELGAVLRMLREKKGLTVKQVAEHLMCSANKVRKMEASFGAGTPRDVRDLCDFYGVTDTAERERLMTLAREGKEKGWWQSYDLAYDTYVGLEAEAIAIYGFQSSVIHGLLQTADYARAGHEGSVPRLSPSQIEKQIEAKLTRQRILTQGSPPVLSAILDEATLHRMVGGRSVMSAQLTKVLEMSALPNVTVQVLPYKLGAHPALESNFTVLELQSPVPGVVYVEGLIGAVYLERVEDLERYHEIFEILKSIALSPAESADLIIDIRESYSGLDHKKGESAVSSIFENALEVRNLRWRKSTNSVGDGACVEAASENGQIFVRDSRNLEDAWLRYPATSWLCFISRVKSENTPLSAWPLRQTRNKSSN